MDQCPCGIYAIRNGRCYTHQHTEPQAPHPTDPIDDGYQPTWFEQPAITADEIRAGLVRLGVQPEQAAMAARRVA